MNRAPILEALKHPNVLAFLRVIRAGESSQDNDAYTVMFGGEHFDAGSGWAHPNKAITRGSLTSTAAGAYQFLSKTWRSLQAQYDIPDFSPAWQDFGAVALIAGRKALDAVLAGRLDEAITRCNREWASLPDSPYGQPTLTRAKCREIFYLYGGTVADPAELPKGDAMSPLVIPILQTLGSAIPALAKMFSSGSEVANRNIAAGQIIADKLIEVTQAVNIQEAAEKIQSDPQLLATAKDVVQKIAFELSEVGGGGIAKARESAADPNQLPFWRNPAVIISVAILPLVYMVAVAVLFGIGGQTWSDDIKTLLVTAIVTGVLGSVTGFFLGSSMGSQRKDSMLGGAK